MSTKGWTLVDVRAARDYELEHAEGAVNVPLYRPVAGNEFWWVVCRRTRRALSWHQDVWLAARTWLVSGSCFARKLSYFGNCFLFESYAQTYGRPPMTCPTTTRVVGLSP